MLIVQESFQIWLLHKTDSGFGNNNHFQDYILLLYPKGVDSLPKPTRTGVCNLHDKSVTKNVEVVYTKSKHFTNTVTHHSIYFSVCI